MILELSQRFHGIHSETIHLSSIQPSLFTSWQNTPLGYWSGTGHGRGGFDSAESYRYRPRFWTLVSSSTSQSWKGLLKCTSQHPPSSPSLFHNSTIVAFFKDAILKRVRQTFFSLKSLAQMFHQKLVQLPFPKRVEVLTLNSSHHFLMSFQRLIPKETLVVQPPSNSQNFPQIIFLHKLILNREPP